MAFVTRCPYCHAVWLLPCREIADVSPVKCSACKSSFDATRDILEVPDQLFPLHDFARDAALMQQSQAQQAESLRKQAIQNKLNELQSLMNDFEGKTPGPAAPAPATAEPAVPEAGNNAQQTSDETKPDAAHPAGDSAVQANASPLSTDENGQTEPTISAISVLPENPSSRIEPVFTAARENSPAEKPSDPAANPQAPADGHSAALKAPTRAHAAASPKKSGIFSFLLLIVLVVVALAIAAIVYNREVIKRFPQTTEIYEKACQQIPCPGFFLHNINAFVVTKTSINVDHDPDNYRLEATIQNLSDFAQALPDLEISLSGEADKLLFKRVLTPADYLIAESRVESLMPGKSMSVQISVQVTNITPTNCTVRPVYSQR